MAKKSSIYLERAHFRFNPQNGNTEPELVAVFSTWGEWRGARTFLENFGGAQKRQITLKEEIETQLDMDKIRFHSYGNNHSINIRGKHNLGVLTNWAAKRSDKAFFDELRELQVTGAEEAYYRHLPPDERARLSSPDTNLTSPLPLDIPAPVPEASSAAPLEPKAEAPAVPAQSDHPVQLDFSSNPEFSRHTSDRGYAEMTGARKSRAGKRQLK